MLKNRFQEDETLQSPIRTLALTVPDEWLDYNAHMNECYYLQCFSDASDSLLVMAGFDDEYLNDIGSYYSVETHIRHLDEVGRDEAIYITTQILGMVGKKLHIFQRMFHVDGRLLSTAEQMLVHVHFETRKSCEPGTPLKENLSKVSALHAKLPSPEGAGRAISALK